MNKIKIKSLMNPASWQRLSRKLYLSKVPLFPTLITLSVRLIFSCFVSHTTSIGRNLVLGYGGLGVVIHKDAIIGNDCHIDQGVTIGGTGTKLGVPRLGDRVYIGAGAKILGDISVGDGATIGANAVVLTDVPPNGVAVGVPARLVKVRV